MHTLHISGLVTATSATLAVGRSIAPFLILRETAFWEFFFHIVMSEDSGVGFAVGWKR